uniref:Thioredoxin domain-containing protein n=1 Tax=Meloidogyne hapla TaxID=6305 RepID=A0A1I8C1G2_MELHA
MFLFNFSLLFLLLIFFVNSKKIKNHYKTTAAEDPIPAQEINTKQIKTNNLQKQNNRQQSSPPLSQTEQQQNEFSIEDVDEEQIDEILRDTSKNLVIFFYDGKLKCPECFIALSEIEEIDDDIEATGYIEVVKTDDRRVARECGINTFPALVYYRRSSPILYDGDFKDSVKVLRWLRAHDEVATWELNDDNFEWKTHSHSPPEGALQWLVMFYDSEESDCNSFLPMFETVAHKFHRGKFFRYNEVAKDVNGVVSFAMHKFKEQRGHRVPEPPTALEHFYEHFKERLTDAIEDNQKLTAICVGGAILIVSICLAFKAYRIRSEQQSATISSSNRRATNTQ